MTHPVEELAKRIATWGGVPVLVGGSVRDWVMNGSVGSPLNAASADYDVECFGITLPRLKECLHDNGYLYDEVGEQFSVLKVNVFGWGCPLVDISIPRYETSTGDGHKAFQVMINPELTFKEAARRRDFTMNSLGFEILSGELLDPYDGERDIKDRVIRPVSEAFSEDPLRPLRLARFATRFNFAVDADFPLLCKKMRPLANSLPSERIWMEIEKAVHESLYFGDFFRFIRGLGWLDLFPEIEALREVEQDREWHPEGSVFTHTVAALNYWSQNLRTGNKEDDLITAIAILCHDFGKVTHTQYDVKPGHITSHGHEEAGAEPTCAFLHRLRQYELAKEVVPLVENHLAPVFGLKNPRSIRRLSVKVKRLDLLANVSRADQGGRPPRDVSEAMAQIDYFEEQLKFNEIPVGGPKPLVGGDFLIELGITPGPHFKQILDAVYEAQLDGWANTPRSARNEAVKIAREQGFNVEYK